MGKEQGAKLECGGKKWGEAGFFVEPTIFSNVTDNMSIAQEEIFGPVQSILKFKTLDEVIERSNKTSYGLAAGIITKNIDTAFTYAKAVEAGSCWINCYDAVTPQTPVSIVKMLKWMNICSNMFIFFSLEAANNLATVESLVKMVFMHTWKLKRFSSNYQSTIR